MFCIYLRTNSDLCHLQHKLIGFYNPDEKCLQRGTDLGFKYSGLRLVFKGLNVPIAIALLAAHHQICVASVPAELLRKPDFITEDTHIIGLDKQIYVRTALVIISYRRFGTILRSHLQESRIQ